jgi:hypothetical protein
MLHARNSRGNNTGELVMTQILQGAGGGIAAVASQTAAQGSVPHRGVFDRMMDSGDRTRY